MPDCSEITRMGIFDVRSSRATQHITTDVIHWLSVNDFRTEDEAHNAAFHVGIVLPKINIPINTDGSYGDSHTSLWSKATAEYLSQHDVGDSAFEADFKGANPNIVNAWLHCVTQEKGLICWATQTSNPMEILLNVEFRPKSTNYPRPLFVLPDGIEASQGWRPKKPDFKRDLGFDTPQPYWFLCDPDMQVQPGDTFTVRTNSSDYVGITSIPALPTVAPRLIPPSMVGFWQGTLINAKGSGYVTMKFDLASDGSIRVFRDSTYNLIEPTTYRLNAPVQNNAVTININIAGGSVLQRCDLTLRPQGDLRVLIWMVNEKDGAYLEGYLT